MVGLPTDNVLSALSYRTYEVNQSNAEPVSPEDFLSGYSNVSWSTESKAAVRCNIVKSVFSLLA